MVPAQPSCTSGQSGSDCIVASSSQAARALIDLVGRVMSEGSLRGALIGGQAVNCWVEPRITLDVDVTVMSDGEIVRDVVARFVAEGFTILMKQDDGAASGPDFVRMRHAETSVELDMMVAKTEFETTVIGRAVAAPGLPLPVATVEDLLVLKLLASRNKDWKDLYDLGKLPDVDWAYVERWCEVWEIGERLTSLRAELERDRQRVKDLFA